MRTQAYIHKLRTALPCHKLLPMVLLLCVSFNCKSQQPALFAVGNSSGAPATMKLSELKSILMGEKQRWKNGDKILIALMKTNTSLGKATSSRIYDMTGDELNKFWLALVFQGRAQAPSFFSSPAELANYVAQNPGAIGILDKPADDPDIKSIAIDGQKTF